ncbi:cysteine dioxygenase [Shewanella surugensis]|uniref:Cysteine dioxygenase family protein n=1 Tax=Shewanella surugensis TaxID=212020 RepID=A0ABT0L694_9GAMM|nr:cysteine dioxygenase family protein [Shewanella surugensis]MCL1122905.1 cysteine dioxygenase family protein [Shewanella surugensis]
MDNSSFPPEHTPVLSALLDAGDHISFSGLIQQVQLFSKPLSLATICFVLENVMLSELEIKSLASFESDHYCRKCLFRNDHCEILILSWLNGQRSKIHDHLDTVCGVKVLLGQATETRFETAANGDIYATQSVQFDKENTTVSEDNDIHQISNLQADDQPLVTLHIYSPPLQQFHIYQLEDGKSVLLNAQQDPCFYEI